MTIEQRTARVGVDSGRTAPYGLTTSEALRAFREGHPDRLPRNNRWKYFVEDHAAGLHPRGDVQLRLLCPVCNVVSERA